MMGDEVPPNGQGSNDQPLAWLQTFTQQMMQMVNLQMNGMVQQIMQWMDALDQQLQAQAAQPPASPLLRTPVVPSPVVPGAPPPPSPPGASDPLTETK